MYCFHGNIAYSLALHYFVINFEVENLCIVFTVIFHIL